MTLMQKLHSVVRKYIKKLQKFSDNYWFAPFLSVLAGLDYYIFVFPTDGVLISTSMLTPKRWHFTALCLAIGSTLGAFTFAYLVQIHGLPWILQIVPGIDQTQAWATTFEFFEKYGLYLVFAIAATPLVQHPVVILAVLGGTPLAKLTAIVFAGRLVKYLLLSYLGSHAPRLLNKLWGLEAELEEVGVHLPPDTPPPTT